MPETITSYTTFVAATKARASHVNTNFSNHRGTLLPISESTATAATNTYSLGTSEYQWKRSHITAGDWKAGDIKAHHSYNGTAGPGQGWMKCDGRLISEANYNTEHGANSWATYIVSSTLTGKFLPDLRNKYLVGASLTSQTGATTITAVGVSSYSLTLTHAHVVQPHNHAWYRSYNTATTGDTTFDSGGSPLAISAGTLAGNGIAAVNGTNRIGINNYLYTDGATLTSDSWATTVSIQPTSIEVQYYMRII